jgi:hypothetical protein
MLPSMAVAGTATGRVVVGGEEGELYHEFLFRYVAAASEVNAVRARVVGSVVRVRDAVRVAAGRGCRHVTRHEARCPIRRRRGLPPGFGRFSITVFVRANDQDDSVRVVFRRLTYVRVVGGAGDDVIVVDGAKRVHVDGALLGGLGDDMLAGASGRELLVGGAGRDLVRGRGGDDLLVGGPGSDVLRGNGGNDRLHAAGPDPLTDGDVLMGGSGNDVVTYSGFGIYGGMADSVNVDLSDPAGDGRPGENDQLRDIEEVMGGHGANTLTGGDGPDVLVGSSDPNVTDRLDGRGGNDSLYGGDGPNDLIGGPGDDHLEDPTSHASCGAGTDYLVSYSAVMSGIDADCEWAKVIPGARVSPGPLERRGDSVIMRFDPSKAARVRVVVRALQAPHAALARDVVRLPARREAGAAVQIRAIKLTEEGEAQLDAAEPVPVLVKVWRIDDEFGQWTRFHTVARSG